VLERHLLLRLGAASAAYLTVSRKLPGSRRAPWRSRFSTRSGPRIGGVAAPWLFGLLVGSGERGAVFLGYLFGAGLMIGAAGVELAIGVRAERQPLESVARRYRASTDDPISPSCRFPRRRAGSDEPRPGCIASPAAFISTRCSQ